MEISVVVNGKVEGRSERIHKESFSLGFPKRIDKAFSKQRQLQGFSGQILVAMSVVISDENFDNVLWEVRRVFQKGSKTFALISWSNLVWEKRIISDGQKEFEKEILKYPFQCRECACKDWKWMIFSILVCQ